MITALVIIAILSLIIVSVTWICNTGTSDEKGFLIAVCFLALLLAGTYSHYNQPKIDLPDEYLEISRTSSKPDTMITWISNDTIHFRFLVAARQFPRENH